MKLTHEVRDPVHEFVVFDNLEKKLIDSRPYQRLRSIHQLAMSYQVYPGAVHKRFEHCIGVMDLAGRIFDSVFRDDRLRDPDVLERIGDNLAPDTIKYWRKVVRLAGLLHDLGHLPFSHAAEKELLPEGWDHERLTEEFIRHSEIAEILNEVRPAVDPEDIIDLCRDAKKRKDKVIDPWRTLLNELICGNVFGADRIDYLLRDSYHAGVSYGQFDPTRLIDGLRIVVDPETDALALGLEQNCIHSAESMLLARYFMYTQVYFHDVRRAYDEHLTDYLKSWLHHKSSDFLEEAKFPVEWDKMLAFTDEEVLAAVRADLLDKTSSRHVLATRVLGRQHFRTVYELTPPDVERDPDIVKIVFDAVKQAVGDENCRMQTYGPKAEINAFPVILDNSTGLERADKMSPVLKSIPPLHIGLVFADKRFFKEAKEAVQKRLETIASGSE